VPGGDCRGVPGGGGRSIPGSRDFRGDGTRSGRCRPSSNRADADPRRCGSHVAHPAECTTKIDDHEQLYRSIRVHRLSGLTTAGFGRSCSTGTSRLRDAPGWGRQQIGGTVITSGSTAVNAARG
jgi:hypothetical protein